MIIYKNNHIFRFKKKKLILTCISLIYQSLEATNIINIKRYVIPY